MTCGHCVNAVSSEIGKLAGVTDVAVDLATGTVTVTSEAPLDPQAVRDAVDEAGYDLVDPQP
jgi:copper chaperone CopZ